MSSRNKKFKSEGSKTSSEGTASETPYSDSGIPITHMGIVFSKETKLDTKDPLAKENISSFAACNPFMISPLNTSNDMMGSNPKKCYQGENS